MSRTRRGRIVHVGCVFHVLVPRLPSHVPFGVTEFMIISGVVCGEVVVIVLTIVDGVGTDVDVRAPLEEYISRADVARQLVVGRPMEPPRNLPRARFAASNGW